MGTKLYIGNLSYSLTDQDLSKLFSPFGEVKSARVVTDKETGRSKGFGFVEMGTDDEAQKAIEGMDGNEVQGRQLKVNEARPRPERPMHDRGGDRPRSFRGDRPPRSDRGGRF
jgi:cold-inducible RNA-binding protein